MKPSDEIAMLREALRVERARADEAYALLDLATAAVKRATAALTLARAATRARKAAAVDAGASER